MAIPVLNPRILNPLGHLEGMFGVADNLAIFEKATSTMSKSLGGPPSMLAFRPFSCLHAPRSERALQGYLTYKKTHPHRTLP